MGGVDKIGYSSLGSIQKVCNLATQFDLEGMTNAQALTAKSNRKDMETTALSSSSASVPLRSGRTSIFLAEALRRRPFSLSRLRQLIRLLAQALATPEALDSSTPRLFFLCSSPVVIRFSRREPNIE
jgi:hypothetical protein